MLELTAGTGRVLLPLARAGIDLNCVDISGPMLARLRAKLAAEVLRAEVVEADVATLDLPRRDYALVLLPFQWFGELVSVEAQRDALERIAAHMAPGARFVCTLHNPAVRRRTIDGPLRLVGSFPVPEQDRTLLLWSVQVEDPREPVVGATQLYELYDPGGLLVEKCKLDVRFPLVEREGFEAMAAGGRLRGRVALWHLRPRAVRPRDEPVHDLDAAALATSTALVLLGVMSAPHARTAEPAT